MKNRLANHPAKDIKEENMAKMNVTEKDFEAFLQATESLMAISGTLDDDFNEEAYAINRQFKNFKRRYLKAKEGSRYG